MGNIYDVIIWLYLTTQPPQIASDEGYHKKDGHTPLSNDSHMTRPQCMALIGSDTWENCLKPIDLEQTRTGGKGRGVGGGGGGGGHMNPNVFPFRTNESVMKRHVRHDVDVVGMS